MKKLIIVTLLLWVAMVGMVTFGEDYKLADREKIEGTGYTMSGPLEFREGLITVFTKTGQGFTMNYLDENYKLVDLNKGRYAEVYGFSEGLAAVVNKDTGKLGYINREGQEVIPCQYGRITKFDMVYAGYFKNGKAMVTQTDVSPFSDPFGPAKAYTVEEIDKTGKVVSQSRQITDGMDSQYVVSDLGHFMVPIEAYVAVEKINVLNEAKLTFTDWVGYDSGHGVHYTLKNTKKNTSKTNYIDQSYYALLFGDIFEFTGGEIHFLKSTSLEGDETLTGEFPTQFNGTELVAKRIKMYHLKFESKEAMEDFRSKVQYKAFKENEAGSTLTDYIIDQGPRGRKWIMDTFINFE